MLKNVPPGWQQRNKKCKCLKTRCLKLYCECFSSGLLCSDLCRCEPSCQNQDKTQHDRETRNGTILEIIKKHPFAFRKSIDSEHRESSNVGLDEESSCAVCGSVTTSGNRCTCIRSPQQKLNHILILRDSPTFKGKKKRFKATRPTRQYDDETIKSAMVLEPISANSAPESSIEADQSTGGSDVSRDLSQLPSDVAEGKSSEGLVQKTFDIMEKVLAAGIPKSAPPQKRSMHSILYPATLAQQILTNVSAQVKHLLQCADEAETQVRSTAEEGQPKLKTPPSHNGKNISVGATFRKHFDSLGEFEGVVVALPTSNNPLYEVEYEDGGSESLTYESLVALVAVEPESQNVSTEEETSEVQDLLEQQIQCARDNAIEEACQSLLLGENVVYLL